MGHPHREPRAGGACATIEDGNVDTHSFETLTLAPIDRRLIDTSIMTREELVWLDAYHARVLDALSPHLDAADRQWLATACAPLRD